MSAIFNCASTWGRVREVRRWKGRKFVTKTHHMRYYVNGKQVGFRRI